MTLEITDEVVQVDAIEQMRRCPQWAPGAYRVTFEFRRGEYGDEVREDEITVPIGPHTAFQLRGDVVIDGLEHKNAVVAQKDPPPTVSNHRAYEGELCIHELRYVRFTPGREYPRHYHFTVERIA